MADWFVVRLPRASGDPASWIAVDDQGHMLAAPGAGTLTQAAAQAAAGRRVAALVPADHVLLTDAALPARAGAKLAQLVPYALEEQVADDIDALHFAVGRRNAETGRTSVGVVDRSIMQAAGEALLEAGIAPAALYSEASLIAPNPGQVVAWLDGDTLVVASPARAPIVVPVTSLRGVFEFLASTHAYGEGVLPATLSLQLVATSLDWQQHAGELDFLQEHFASARVQLLPQGSLPWLASQIHAAAPLNLLQGEYAPRIAGGAEWRRWRVPAALAAALLLVFVGGKIYQVQRLDAAERALDAEIDQTFRMAMPGAADSTDARRRMAQRYASLQDGGGNAGLLPALNAFASARAAVPDASLQGISLREGSLDLRVRAADAASLDQINQQLRASGYTTELSSGTAEESGYEGRIHIRLAGA